jgi:gamma-glutamyl:cysteine ligase YbdK (ATP-grasp superfamily)
MSVTIDHVGIPAPDPEASGSVSVRCYAPLMISASAGRPFSPMMR